MIYGLSILTQLVCHITDKWHTGSAQCNSVDQSTREATCSRRPILYGTVHRGELRVLVLTCRLFTVGGVIESESTTD